MPLQTPIPKRYLNTISALLFTLLPGPLCPPFSCACVSLLMFLCQRSRGYTGEWVKVLREREEGKRRFTNRVLYNWFYVTDTRLTQCNFPECQVTHGQFLCLLLWTPKYTGVQFTAKEMSQICSSVQKSPLTEGSVLWLQPSLVHSSKVVTSSLACFLWIRNLILIKRLSWLECMNPDFQMKYVFYAA